MDSIQWECEGWVMWSSTSTVWFPDIELLCLYLGSGKRCIWNESITERCLQGLDAKLHQGSRATDLVYYVQ